jgi:UDP-N-acetyl-D-glucosamine dehydrogenase
MTSVEVTREELAKYDCVVVLTDHTSFDYPLIVGASKLILDTRNAIGAAGGSHVFRLGAPQKTSHKRATTQEVVAQG